MSDQTEENVVTLALAIGKVWNGHSDEEVGPDVIQLWQYILRCLPSRDFEFLWGLNREKGGALDTLIMESVTDDMIEDSPERSVMIAIEHYFGLYEEWTSDKNDFLTQLVEACGYRHPLGGYEEWVWMFCHLPIREDDLVLLQGLSPEQLEVIMPGSSYGSIENDPDLAKLLDRAPKETWVELDKRLNHTYALFEEFVADHPENWRDLP